MTETRIEVHQSDVKTVYIPQYKVKFLCFSWWEDFSHDCVGLTFLAYCRGVKRYDHGTKEYAEHVCEQYAMMKAWGDEDKNKERLHKQTNKVSHYKHP